MIYAIGDSHGEIEAVEKLHTLIIKDIEKVKDDSNIIIWLGDYIDRGANSKAVLDFIINLNNSDTLTYIFLKGNHEQFMIDACGRDPSVTGSWMANGGYETLKSFGFNSGISIPDFLLSLTPYLDWFKNNLKLYYETDDYVFCHSGYIRFDFPISLDNQADNLLWGRPHYGMYENYNKIVVHGHTPTKSGHPEYESNRICVDTGCGKYSINLACAVLPNKQRDELEYRYIQI